MVVVVAAVKKKEYSEVAFNKKLPSFRITTTQPETRRRAVTNQVSTDLNSWELHPNCKPPSLIIWRKI